MAGFSAHKETGKTTDELIRLGREYARSTDQTLPETLLVFGATIAKDKEQYFKFIGNISRSSKREDGNEIFLIFRYYGQAAHFKTTYGSAFARYVQKTVTYEFERWLNMPVSAYSQVELMHVLNPHLVQDPRFDGTHDDRFEHFGNEVRESKGNWKATAGYKTKAKQAAAALPAIEQMSEMF